MAIEARQKLEAEASLVMPSWNHYEVMTQLVFELNKRAKDLCS